MSDKINDAGIFVVIEPKKRADYDKMERALRQIAKKHPPLHIKTVSDGFKITVYGMTDAHLEIVISSLKQDFNLDVVPGRFQVAYNETIRVKVVEESKFTRTTGTPLSTEYGHCVIQLEPLPRGAGFQFADGDKRGHVPKKFVPAIEEGIKLTLSRRGRGQYPMTDVKITLIDGSSDPKNSTEFAFRNAGALAANSGRLQAKRVIIEPIMDYEIRTPEPFMGDVLGDLNGRRALIQDMGDVKDSSPDSGVVKFVRCHVPLAEVIGYARRLWEISAGSANVIVEAKPHHWAEVDPENIKAIADPHGTDEPPAASAGRPVEPIRPRPGISGKGKQLPPQTP